MWLRGSSASWLLTLCLSPNVATRLHSSRADQAHVVDTDLHSLLQDTTLSQEKELSDTLAWFNKLHSESSCIQLAAMKLMTECKLLDHPSDFARAHPDLYLDDVKVEYAVKLAVCEIVGAQPDHPFAPQHCEVFIPSTEACAQRSWWSRAQTPPHSHLPCYPQTSEKHLPQCLKTLRTSPQFWTSFSNAKFRAVNMCQISRHAIERDKTLQLHRNLSQVTFQVHSSLRNVKATMRALQDELKQSADDLKRSHTETNHATDEFKMIIREAQKDAKLERQMTKKELQSVQIEIGTMRDRLISDITAHNNKFNTHMDATVTRAVAAVRDGHTDTLVSIGAELQTFYRGLQSEASELIASMHSRLQEHHEKALLAIQVQHGAVMESYNIISDTLGTTNSKVDIINGKVDILDNNTDRSLGKLLVIDHLLDGIGSKIKTIEQIATLYSVFTNFLWLCVVVALAFGALLLTGVARRVSPIFAWMAIIVLTLGGLLQVLSTYWPIIRFPRSTEYLAIEPAYQLPDYLHVQSAKLWAILAIICFVLAAFLHNINVFCERLMEGLATFSRVISGRSTTFSRQNTQDATSTASLPGLDIPV